MKTMNIQDVKKIRIRRQLICTGGPKGGYSAGIVLDAPFPPEIQKEIQLTWNRIMSGVGAIEILEIPVEVAPVDVAPVETAPVKVVPIEDLLPAENPPVEDPQVEDEADEVDGGEPGESDEPVANDPPKDDETKGTADETEPAPVRPACLNTDVAEIVDAIAARRELRAYAQQRFDVKIDWRLSLEKMIEQVRLLEAGI